MTAEGRLILGIDPGTTTTGWGLVRQRGPRLAYVQHGAITTPPDWAMPRRLSRLFDGVTQLVEGYEPDAVAVEELFWGTNVTTGLTVVAKLARGVALLAAYSAGGAGLTVAEYTPLQVKQATTSYGRADKRQVRETVRALLGLTEVPRPDDAADGLAIAITHAFSSRLASPERAGRGRTDRHSAPAGPGETEPLHPRKDATRRP